MNIIEKNAICDKDDKSMIVLMQGMDFLYYFIIIFINFIIDIQNQFLKQEIPIEVSHHYEKLLYLLEEINLSGSLVKKGFLFEKNLLTHYLDSPHGFLTMKNQFSVYSCDFVERFGKYFLDDPSSITHCRLHSPPHLSDALPCFQSARLS